MTTHPDLRTTIETARTRLGLTAEAMCKGIMPSSLYSNFKHGRIKSLPPAKLKALMERLGITAEGTGDSPIYVDGGADVNPLNNPTQPNPVVSQENNRTASEVVQSNAAKVVAEDDRRVIYRASHWHENPLDPFPETRTTVGERLNYFRVKMRDGGLTKAELDEMNALEGR